jgi:GNAT superfamily N-acetyltransferase
VAPVIRELAENPNVHQRLSPPRQLLRDPDGRFALYLAEGTGVHQATVQRVRTTAGGVEQLVADVRRALRTGGREGAEWELGASCLPEDLVERLLALGLRLDPDEPVALGMALRGRPAWQAPENVQARRVASVDELREARRVQATAFGLPSGDGDGAERDWAREGVDGATFVALVDGAIVAAAYAAYTPWGLLLFGGATSSEARGRGAYRALVAARADEAEARGTPVLVVHAGRMSRPILERLGFETVARIDRLLDVLA